jgi:hypothetical protein
MVETKEEIRFLWLAGRTLKWIYTSDFRGRFRMKQATKSDIFLEYEPASQMNHRATTGEIC